MAVERMGNQLQSHREAAKEGNRTVTPIAHLHHDLEAGEDSKGGDRRRMGLEGTG